jgi:hypothetical protein
MGTYRRKKPRASKKKPLARKKSKKITKAAAAKRTGAKRATATKRATPKKASNTRRLSKSVAKPTQKRLTAPKVACPHCGARSGSPCKGRSTHVVRVKRAAEAKKRKKTPAQKRKTKNKKIVKRVEKRNKLRDKSRGKTLTSKRKKLLAAQAAEEKKRIEKQRLFDERLRQIKDEQQRQKASKSAIVMTLQKRFNALLTEAKKSGQLPRVPRQRLMMSERMEGYKRHVGIGKILLPELVEEIMYQVKQKALTLPRKPAQGWLAVINFASLGESLLGYGQVILSSSLPGASLFQVQGIESSGMHNTMDGMLMKLQEKLEDLAGEVSATVYVNYITVSAYTRRS